ncbi:pre-mRNA polyadenylation factor FIP1 [Colletotrichum higginsianum]|uniref:Pre-mRNA polyadenylation factor FIP1 n=1 Tax=Colletotrichum higginsianum TaxID=80884 RepID=A0A4T0W401_9PEZI|nr:Pre-mRNA polyadenylation factor FIP1 [Colletotrichum higginsianum]GJC94577.1 pre-mRNA polyadenylation factor FIP1 [Colletotrichum higginsianum]
MDIDEDDDFYGNEDPAVETSTTGPATEAAAPENKSSPKVESKSEELEEGEEEDEGGAMDEDEDDSDIEIVTERKDGTKAAPPTQSRYSDIRNIPQRSASNDMTVKAAPLKKEEASAGASPSDLPLGVPSADKAAAAASKSTIDVNANPDYPPVGKPITAVNIDEDLTENDKPWRKPGTDISDYFNYGFDEFTWALYAAKQEAVRGEFSGDAIAAGQKKMMEDFGMMMMGGMNPAAAGAQGGGMPGMAGGGMDGMPPEMQAMMQQMMGQGMDPSQMDPSAMSAMFSGMQGQAGNAGGQGGQGQNFNQGFGGNQGQYGGYDQQGMGGGGGNRGGFGGRGRGGRRQW